MKIFTQEFLTNIKTRYEKQGVMAPPLYRFATVEKFKPLRETLQTWVDRLPNKSQIAIVRNLRNPKSFYHTYNELKIAAFLLQRYGCIEYEVELDGVTPDWCVKNETGRVMFIVEALTKEVSAEDRSLSTRIVELWEKIRKMEFPVGIHLSYGDEFDPKTFDSRQIKNIAVELEKWLRSSPLLETTITIENVDIKLIHYNEKYKSVQITGPSSKAFWVNGSPLKSNLEEKIKKYTNLVDNLKVPLILGVAPTFETAISRDTLMDILFGGEKYEIRDDLTAQPCVRSGGLFDEKKSLSAVIGCFESEYAVFHNPNAKLSSKDFI